MDRATGNLIITLLLVILFISMVKIGGGLDASKFQVKNCGIPQTLSQHNDIFDVNKEQTEQQQNTVVLKDFDTNVQEVVPDENISYSTAINYFNTRALSQTENLVLQEDNLFGKYFERGNQKKLVIYKSVNKSFNSELNSKLKKYSQNPNMKIFNANDIFAVRNEAQIKNSKERLIYRLYNECGNFCIIDVPQSKIYALKGINANAKSAAVCDVILQNL